MEATIRSFELSDKWIEKGYAVVDAADVELSEQLYFPNGVPGFPKHWIKWRVVKVTKNTVQVRHGRPGSYIKTDKTLKKIKANNEPQKLCILNEDFNSTK
jgi:hypothetical protein